MPEALKQKQKLGCETQAASSSNNPAPQRATSASSDASDPAAASRDASELTAGAEKEEDMANLIKDQSQHPVRRKARDGVLYTKEEFLDFYKDDGSNMWDVADQTKEFGTGAA